MKTTFNAIRNLPIPPNGFIWIVYHRDGHSELLISPDTDNNTAFGTGWATAIITPHLELLATHGDPWTQANAAAAIEARTGATGDPQ